MLKLLDEDIVRIEISELKALKVLGDLRWTGKAKFPGSPRPRSMVIFQLGNDVAAISSFCPHENADLSAGRFVEPYVLECPLHHNRYDLRNGEIKAFGVELSGDTMYLLWRRSANEPVAPRFNQAKLAERSHDEHHETLQAELRALREATKARELHTVETLRQMEGMIREVEDKKALVDASHAELAKVNEFVQRVTDTMSEALVVVDTQGTIVEVNRRFVTLLEHERAAIVGKPLSNLMAGANGGTAQFDLSALSAGKEAEFDACFVSKQGVLLEHLVRVAPLYGARGKREGAVVVGTDIRTVKAAQRELADAYGKVSNLLDNMQQAVFVVLASGEIIEPVSRFTRQIFDADVVGRNVFDLLYRDIPRDSEAFSLLETAFLASFGAEEFQYDLMADFFPRRIVLKAGADRDQTRILKVDYCPLRDASGLMDRLMLVIDDYTKVELLEAQKQAGERRTQVLEELAKNRPQDLSEFFGAAYNQMREARSTLDQGDPAALTVMFRHLHTIKGNARVLGLSLIAQAAHEAESVASVLRGEQVELRAVREKVLDALSAIQRQLAEYGDVAERILHIPNDLEARALQELHAAVIQLDAELGLFFDATRDERDTQARLKARSARKLAGVCRSAADAASSEPLSQAIRALEHALASLEQAGQVLSASTVAEIAAAHGTLVEEALARRMRSPSGTGYSLNTSSWTALCLDVYALTLAVSKASDDADGILEIERAAERVLSTAGALSAEYIAALLAFVPVGARGPRGRLALEQLLRELWRHLALHATLESIALLRPEERGLLAEALAGVRSGDEALVQLLEGGRVRASSTVGFVGALRRAGTPAVDILNRLGKLLDLTELPLVARALSNTSTHENLPLLLAAVDARTTRAGFDAWLQQMGAPFKLFTEPARQGLTYLKRLDVLRLAQAVRELVMGNFQMLFDRVQTVEVMAFHFSRLQKCLGDFKQTRNPEALDALERTILHLLDVPVLPSLQKYYAMVADLATRLGRRAVLHIHGDPNAALPREMLYPLHDALVHLLRNALDHGLEPPDERIERGKGPVGALEVQCSVEAGQLTLVLRDDGRGIDPERVKRRAVQLGMLSEEAARTLSDGQAVDLIFMPHFSTAGSVTDISGRGIGMDVVRESLSRVGGSVRIESRVGVGTDFIITLARLGEPPNDPKRRV
jgi:PAS domain S-box-containing protein